MEEESVVAHSTTASEDLEALLPKQSSAVPSSDRAAIKEHNDHIKWYLKQSLLPLACRGLIYETGSSRPRLVLVPACDDWDPACGAEASTLDLDVSNWFEGQHQVITPINTFPGTECRLTNGYDIISLHTDNHTSTDAPINAAIISSFAMRWPGNLLVVKQAQSDRSRVISITASEVPLANAMVHR
ncbi:hypothetical protein NUW54_g1070 [Trametes sanguinea]|uniref:Uncharacterized protein n=2 Tax=Trametes sanguinea TaxID=158606 RepID=A0ACC1PZF8_9APHY|nr:hypothetical protein NUW54_g4455 [Trametes sanguinea]KAJ3015336.1 hypothetical protein NUW54_g1070 [Trametes sanguinea]